MPATIPSSTCLWRMALTDFSLIPAVVSTAATLHMKMSWNRGSGGEPVRRCKKFRITLQHIQHVPMTPLMLTLKAKKEDVIQPLYNIIGQLTEAKIVFSDHMGGEIKAVLGESFLWLAIMTAGRRRGPTLWSANVSRSNCCHFSIQGDAMRVVALRIPTSTPGLIEEVGWVLLHWATAN